VRGLLPRRYTQTKEDSRPSKAYDVPCLIAGSYLQELEHGTLCVYEYYRVWGYSLRLGNNTEIGQIANRPDVPLVSSPLISVVPPSVYKRPHRLPLPSMPFQLSATMRLFVILYIILHTQLSWATPSHHGSIHRRHLSSDLSAGLSERSLTCEGKHFIAAAYYPSWLSSQVPLSNVNFTQYSHVIYAFMWV
jgi:hypothetical protein